MFSRKKFIARLLKTFSVKENQASIDIIEARIMENSTVTGTNMYILIFSILIASVGLNVNSTAVVIGAMLISPLMNIILTIADNIANHHLSLVRQSIIKFLFQIAISIITSTVYFSLSPLSGFSDELFARTQPTFWDVIIAICGGFAAIIAHTRKSIVSNVIPGAAIATALMPPLCTVGYCLSTAKWMYALGAFYLFAINSFFICVSGIIGLYMMGLTRTEKLITTRKKLLGAVILTLLIIIPSAVMGWRSVNQASVMEQYRLFMDSAFNYDDTLVVKSGIDIPQKTISVALIGEVLDEKTLEDLRKSLSIYGFAGYDLKVTQTQIEQGVSESDIKALLMEKKKSDEASSDAQALLDLQREGKERQSDALKELMILYPNISSCGFVEMQDNNSSKSFSLILMVRENLTEEQILTIESWLKTKFKNSERKLHIIQILAATG